jgi:vacuolar-type H+-ATPase subunit H
MQPPGKCGWLRTLRHMVIGMCLVCMVEIGILLNMYKQVHPGASYMFALWMLMGNAFDTGVFVKLFFGSLMALVFMMYYPTFMKEVKEEKQKAAAIEAKAQRVLEDAEKKADDITASALKDAGEIKKEAKEAGTGIRIKAREEATVEAEDLLSQAKKQAHETRDEFWLLLQAKAKDMGIADEELQGLVKVLQKAREEAAAINAQAEGKAQEAADKIIKQAEKERGEIIEKAKQEAQEIIDKGTAESEGVLYKARLEAANILLTPREEQEAPQITDDVHFSSSSEHHATEGLPEEQVHAEKNPDTPDDVDDQVVALVEEKIVRMLSGVHSMRKRDLERKGHKYRYGSSWDLAISNLLAAGKILYDAESNTYRCQHELFQ